MNIERSVVLRLMTLPAFGHFPGEAGNNGRLRAFRPNQAGEVAATRAMGPREELP